MSRYRTDEEVIEKMTDALDKQYYRVIRDRQVPDNEKNRSIFFRNTLKAASQIGVLPQDLDERIKAREGLQPEDQGFRNEAVRDGVLTWINKQITVPQ